jgi:hypothetical protein
MPVPPVSVFNFFRRDPRLKMWSPLGEDIKEYVSGKHGVATNASVRAAPGRGGVPCREKTIVNGQHNIYFGSGSDWQFGTQMTAMIWFNKNNTNWSQAQQYLFSKNYQNNLYWRIIIRVDPFVGVQVNGTGGAYSGLRGVSWHFAGRGWTHVAFTTDGSHLRLFINGTLVGSTPCTGNPNHTTPRLRVGDGVDAVNSDYGYIGQVQEPALFDAPLSPREIRAYYRYATLARPLRKQHFATSPPPPAPTGLSVLGGDRKNTISWAWSP